MGKESGTQALMSGLETRHGVVGLQWVDEAIAVVTMEDRGTKNRFSTELVAGLQEAFGVIESRPEARAVVIQGYEQYFCCGGTERELLELAERKIEFSSFTFYDRLLKCPLPVVAAMQGHAIGGGLVFGAYADLLVLAEECIYNTNFMEYGFTPGLGATFIIPNRFGPVLGWEMLFTARSYHGGDLRARGAAVQVVPRGEVPRVALGLARELAGKRVEALRALKRRQVDSFQPGLARAVAQELEMHKEMFADATVRERILARYGR